MEAIVNSLEIRHADKLQKTQREVEAIAERLSHAKREAERTRLELEEVCVCLQTIKLISS